MLVMSLTVTAVADVTVVSLAACFVFHQEEREKKRIAQQDKKAEIRALEENENKEMTPKAAPQKITAYQLQVRLL